MARHIDLRNKLDMERPTIKIGEKTYTVNDEKSNVLLMNSALAEEGLDQNAAVDKVITILLGKTALKEINALKLGLSQYMIIFYALVACVNDIEIEEAKERFQNAQ